MKSNNIQILASQVIKNLLVGQSTRWLLGIFIALTLFGLFSGYVSMRADQKAVNEFSHTVREQWEANPDKHPHRMAHYGYVVFRQKYPLSFFDSGMDSFVGNSIFLEAHKQNTANFSKASMSSGLLRFGEISAAMIMQLLLPLLIFFWGFNLIASERENGTLRLLLTQGVSWKELIVGKTLGLFSVGLLIFIPAVAIGLVLLVFTDLFPQNPDLLPRYILLIFSYLVYLFIVSLIAVLVSAHSKTGKASLITLIGLWLIFTLILPRVSQVAGQALYPSPSKIEFDAAVEEELVKGGDSHNPDDPHFIAQRDSVLRAHKVDSTHKLPFNYAGFRMREGEKVSTETFIRHQKKLVDIYISQQNVPRFIALVNPFMAIKNISMALSGTDYATFNDFQGQAEDYRYYLAQTMNELQMKYISNDIKYSADKRAVLERRYWVEFPHFEYQSLKLMSVLKNEWFSFLALAVWVAGLTLFISYTYTTLKAL
jgi:ABC-2 type transport system permease protein